MFSGVNQQSAADSSHQEVKTEFSPEQIRQLSELINQAVNSRTLMTETADSKGDQGESEPSEVSGGMSFKLNDIRYFNSELTTDFTIDEEDIHQIEQNMFFTDVYLFIKKLKDVAVSYTLNQVKMIILSCL